MEEIKISDHFTYKRMLLFAMPTIGMILISITYDVVDGYFISNFIGKTAFSAVNIIYPFHLMLSMVGYMFGSGGSALIAAELGNDRRDKANQFFTIIIRTCFILSIVFMIAGIVLLPWASKLLGATPEIMVYGLPYGRTLFLFLPIMTLGYAFQSLLITAEKPKIGFFISIGNLCSNIIFDYLFVVVFHWGMVGAAVATGIGACLNGIIPLIYFSRDNSSLLRFVKAKMDFKALLSACSNGASEMVNDMSTSIIFILYNYQLLRMLGEDGVAAYGMVIFVEGIFASVFYGLAMESTTVVGYHYGSKNYPELKNLLKKGIVINLCSGVIMFFTCRLFAPFVAGLYLGYDDAVFNLAVHALRLYSFTFILQGFNEYASAYFTGLNNGLISGILALGRTFVIQTICILALPLLLGTNGLWLAQPVAEVIACILAIFFYIIRRHEYCG